MITFTVIRRQLHPDREREQRAARDGAPKHEDDERLLGADPAGRDRHEGREALRHLDEEDVAEALRRR